MATDTIFRAKAPGIMRKLMADFELDALSAAAIVGNLGHESGGFKFLQEKQPLIPGSAGGYGWAQWTGPRRRAYEAYCQRNNLDPASDKANYAYLFVELTTSEDRAIPAVKRAVGMRNKVEAFELAFERAGVKHYDSREKWATIALAAYGAAPRDVEPVKVKKPSGGRVAAGTGAVIVTTGAGAVIAKHSSDKGASMGSVAVVVGATLVIAIAAYFIIRHWKTS